MRSDEIQKTIKKGLGNYRVKQVNISGKPCDLYVFSEDEDLNLFEGFLFTEITEKSELSHLISRYRAPVSGYVPRLSFLLYRNQLIIKDYRKNRLIRKTLQKINKSFISKLKKSLTNPDESNFNKLFDRTDIIEEFWILYKKSRDYLLENITGFSEEDEKIAFVDNLMMQMLTLWYLQEKRFFDGDTSYFITKFTEMEQKKLFDGFKNYYGLLTHFFEIIGNNVGNQYHEGATLGKVVVLGPAIFLNGNIDQAAITIPDRWFYKEGMTDTLINTPPKKVGADVPLFNLFESRDWTKGNIDDFVLGAIYEKLITHIERKKLGAYYTPEAITEYICKNTIEPYLIDKVNCETGSNFKSIDEIVESDDKEMLLRLFDSLNEIKILDPAVGSAHFLADAIEVLLGVYEKIWDRAKERGLRRGLEITAADERGRLKNINLLEISDRDRGQFRIYIKFFIILSKNIYGVDINQSAINVARARLFLSIAKHFDAGKGCFIRFPNVHFNLRRGNSLIGYVGMGAEKERKQSTFDMFVNEKEVGYAAKPIKVVAELGDYLPETARTIGMEGDILNEVVDLNGILSMERIGWSEFEGVLRVKEKLIRILIASLNSEHAIPLNNLIKKITELFNAKLNERFASEREIDPGALDEIGTFHWGMEFPEVFLERGGFDVVVGNPPYFNIETTAPSMKDCLKTTYEIHAGKADILYYFYSRGLDVLIEKGRLGFITSRYFMEATHAKKLRKTIQKNAKINFIVDFGDANVFVGVGIHPSILILEKSILESSRESNNIKVTKILSYSKNVPGNVNIISTCEDSKSAEIFYLSQKNLDIGGWRLTSKLVVDILKTMEDNSWQLVELCEIEQGQKSGLNKVFAIDEETIYKYNLETELLKKLIKNSHVGRYSIDYRDLHLIYINDYTKIDDYPNTKKYFEIFKNELKNRAEVNEGKYSWFRLQRPRDPRLFNAPEKLVVPYRAPENRFAYDAQKFYNDGGDIRIVVPKDGCGVSLKYILGVLNSKLLSFYYKFIGRKKGEVYEYFVEPLSKIPIKEVNKSNEIGYNDIKIISNYLLYLYNEKRNNEIGNIETVFDHTILDFLVYELYFCEKFYEDGLYPEPKPYLSELVSKHLKTIPYNRWAELHWKKQLEENLTPEEEKELEELETENTKTIGGVYDAIVNDEAIQKQIERIGGHEWVRVVEGEE